MSPHDVLCVLLERLGANDGAAVLIREHELTRWPTAAVAALKSQRILVKASPAPSVVCPGCEDECVMPVYVLNYPTGRAAFVVCVDRNDVCRVPVASNQLEQWQTSANLIADLLARLLGLRRPSASDAADSARWEVGLFKGRQHSGHLVLLPDGGSLKLTLAGHSVTLSDLLFLEGQRFEVDRRALTRLVDQPIAGGGDQESAAQRHERLMKRIDVEKAKGTKAFLKTIAEEEGISVQRLKQIRAAKSKPAKAPPTW